MDKTYSVKELSELYSVTAQTVLTWIKNGELKAVNVGRSMSKLKPRWRITTEALIAFELLRTGTPTPRRLRGRKHKHDTSLVEFY